MPEPSGEDAFYVGLISGTSMDGIDAVVARFGDRRCDTVASRGSPYPDDLREALLATSRNPDRASLDSVGELDHRVGCCFRDAALALLDEHGIPTAKVAAIGSHGQTLRHRPDAAHPFTLQIGDPNVIACGTGITTVADFRRRDMADGGQGAPLAPAFHAWLFGGTDRHRVVLNIGGFANVTLLPAGGGEVTGFDTGPGNVLLDGWTRRHRRQPFDHEGRWAASGEEIANLLRELRADPWFGLPPPKSTGFEYFDQPWLEARLSGSDYRPEDVQATLVALTATTIADAVRRCAPATDEVLACGGGVHNPALMHRLADALGAISLSSTADHGLDPDWVEAVAFAWLARQTLAGEPGNLPAVTGARHPQVLGGVYR